MALGQRLHIAEIMMQADFEKPSRFSTRNQKSFRLARGFLNTFDYGSVQFSGPTTRTDLGQGTEVKGLLGNEGKW